MLTPEREAEIRTYCEDTASVRLDTGGIPAELHPSSPTAMLPALLSEIDALRAKVAALEEQVRFRDGTLAEMVNRFAALEEAGDDMAYWLSEGFRYVARWREVREGK